MPAGDLPMGRRGIAEGGVGAGAGAGAAADRRGRPRGRPQGVGGGCSWLPGVRRELVGSAVVPAGWGMNTPRLVNRGRAHWDLGRAAQRLAGGRRIALLEPRSGQCAGAAAVPLADRGDAGAGGGGW